MRIVTLLLAGLCASLHAQSHTIPDLQHAKQIIVVTTPDWNAVDGTLTRYSRRPKGWARVTDPIPIVVGKNGLAWNPNLANPHPDHFSGPVKHEGDGRAPAGVFKLSNSFGFAESTSLRNYLPLTATTECVDDVNSKHYAQIVDRSSIKDVDWKSSEKMRSVDLYRWGVVVSYNMEHPVPGHGSCIFLHVWRGPGQGTAGCTAMPEESIRQIIHWINNKTPSAILIQLPQSEYERLKKDWQLP